MKNSWWICLWAFSTLVSGAGGEPGSPGTATPQPYAVPAPPALPANPQKPPLLRMPQVQEPRPQRDLPLLERSPGQQDLPERHEAAPRPSDP